MVSVNKSMLKRRENAAILTTEKPRNQGKVVTSLKELREKLLPPLITNQPFEI